MRHARPIFMKQGREIYDHFQLSPAVRAGPFIIISGVIGRDASDQALPGEEDEYHAAFRMIGELLAEEGATFSDIVALDTYHVGDDLSAGLVVFNKVREQYMSAPHPAWTALGIAAIGIAGARAEIRVTAYLGP